MNFPLPTPAQIEAFLLVFLRISAIIVLMPVFGEQTTPARVKAGLALIVTFLVFPTLHVPDVIRGTETLALLIVRMAGEVIVGSAIGFSARVIFAGVQMGGELLGIQMGVSIANVLDPITSVQASIISELLYIVALIVFLQVDAHHIYLAAVSESFKTVPILGVHLGSSLAREMLLMTQAVFVTSIKISAPVMAVLLFINVGLGIVARTVPQVNVFIVGFPLQVAGGLIFIGLSMPLMISLLAGDFQAALTDVRKVLVVLGRP